MVKWGKLRFVFVGETVSYSENQLERIGEVLDEVTRFPVEHGEAYDLRKGTEIFTLNKKNYDEAFSKYIYIKVDETNTYFIGFPYYEDDDEQKKVEEYMSESQLPATLKK